MNAENRSTGSKEPSVPKPPVRPRRSQAEIWKYDHGKMGVSAVPGSGKTFTLSHLAAQKVDELISKNLTTQGVDNLPEVLVVTFTNTAVNSFKAKIAEILRAQRGLLPYIGYRVRTLHGLAHDIVRERPSLVGLAEDFQILDDRVSAAILRDCVLDWLKTSGDAFMPYIDQAKPGEDDEESETNRSLRRIRQENLPELAIGIATGFIGEAKDLLLTPAVLRAKLIEVSGSAGELILARFGVEVYEAYQRSLAYRGAVDFNDLVRLALEAMDRDPAYLARRQDQWPFIFEDEAQDSSRLQEKMLSLLSAKHGNWVRVGDPNQSINTTFTTATPQFLRDFLKKPGVKAITLDQAGRSVQPIIDLANSLMRWATKSHPVPVLWKAFHYQEIKPTAPDDDQPNPPAIEGKIHIQYEPGKEVSSEQERKIVVASLEKWLPENPNRTVAVLVPQNSDGFQLSEMLHARGIAYEELLRSTTATREAAKALRDVLDFLAVPIDGGKLARLYREVWWPAHLARTLGEGGDGWRDDASGALSKCRTVEAFLWPNAGLPLDALTLKSDDEMLTDDLEAFRVQVVRWLEGRILPVDQLLLTIGQDLFTEAADIALNYNIAQVLRSMSRENPDWRLPQFTEELRAISENQRKFLDFDDAAQGYEPKVGRVTVATMHAAKGLEWDRVYLMSVSNYAFPSAQPFDKYISEKWFIRDSLNLEAEALAQLQTLTDNKRYIEGEATKQARVDYAAERLRLLYVGITRAKRELIITWNTGRFASKGGNNVNQPALPLVMLSESLNGKAKVNT